MKDRRKLIASAIVNYAAFLIVAVCFILVLFAPDKIELASKSVSERFADAIKYFTVQSNILFAAAALTFAIAETRVLTGAAKKIPFAFIVIKHVFTVGVTVTFLTVALYLSPINEKGYFDLFSGYNFFFHFFVPAIAVASLFLFDGRRFPYRYTALGLLPFLFYGVFYLINAYTHTQGGKVVPEYDWYYFLQGGAAFTAVTITAMIILTFAVSALLWVGERKR